MMNVHIYYFRILCIHVIRRKAHQVFMLQDVMSITGKGRILLGGTTWIDPELQAVMSTVFLSRTSGAKTVTRKCD